MVWASIRKCYETDASVKDDAWMFDNSCAYSCRKQQQKNENTRWKNTLQSFIVCQAHPICKIIHDYTISSYTMLETVWYIYIYTWYWYHIFKDIVAYYTTICDTIHIFLKWSPSKIWVCQVTPNIQGRCGSCAIQFERQLPVTQANLHTTFAWVRQLEAQHAVQTWWNKTNSCGNLANIFSWETNRQKSLLEKTKQTVADYSPHLFEPCSGSLWRTSRCQRCRVPLDSHLQNMAKQRTAWAPLSSYRYFVVGWACRPQTRQHLQQAACPSVSLEYIDWNSLRA